MTDTSIGSTATHMTLIATMEEALGKVTEALKAEGFAILTSIDVRATMQAKLGEDYPPYLILGACNPKLALRALRAAPEVGLLLPCNVTLAQVEPDRVRVSMISPLSLLGLVSDQELQAVAEEATERLQRSAKALSQAA